MQSDVYKRQEEILADKKKIKAVIIEELKAVKKKYAQPRKTMIIYVDEAEETEVEEEIPDYAVNLFLTQEPYLFLHTPDIAQVPELVHTLWEDLRKTLPEIGRCV